MELFIEHGYSNCYPKEQSTDSNCFKVKFETIENLTEYVKYIRKRENIVTVLRV